MDPSRAPPRKSDTRTPFALRNPYQAVVTLDNARHQEAGMLSHAVNSRGGTGNAPGRGRDNPGGGDDSGWEGRDTDLRQMPSQLIAVKDVYPPELSRCVINNDAIP